MNSFKFPFIRTWLLENHLQELYKTFPVFYKSLFTHTIWGWGGGGYVNIPHSHLKEQWSENTNKNKPPFWWEGAPKTLVSLLVAHFDTTVSSLLPPLLPLHLSKGHHLLQRRGSRPSPNHTTWTAISSFQSSSHVNSSVVSGQISSWCWGHPGAPPLHHCRASSNPTLSKAALLGPFKVHIQCQSPSARIMKAWHLPAQHTEQSLQWDQSWDRTTTGPTGQERSMQCTLKASSLLQPLKTSMAIRQTWAESLFQDGHSHADCNTVLPR